MLAAALASVALLAQPQADPRLQSILERVSEEAGVFAQMAPKVIGKETLHQKARKRPPRFRPRIGKAALQPPPVRYQTREIVSEYGYSTFKDAPDSLHEFRQVVSVDGRPVNKVEKARTTLTLGVSSADDRLKKKMLQQFEKYGLVGAATDFGPMLLLFRRRQLANYSFQFTGAGRIGADKALILSYRQLEGPQSLTIFEGRTATRARLQGQLWVRESDSLPLRITLNTEQEEDGRKATYQATVDYARSSHGVMLPASVRYVRLVDGEMMVENLFEYSNFRMFQVEAEIKFTPAEPPPKQ
jgi:hypothetical protein